MVCLGNICRSPLAQGVMEQRLRISGLFHEVSVDSAGTHGYHVGEAGERPGPGIDTPADLEKVRQLMQSTSGKVPL